MNGLILVFLGGGLGASARFGLGKVIPDGILAIFSANLIGSFLMGLTMAWLLARSQAEGGAIWLFLCVGMFGGFTTFSSFSLHSVQMLQEGQVARAAMYVFGSAAGAIGLLFIGLEFGKRVFAQ